MATIAGLDLGRSEIIERLENPRLITIRSEKEQDFLFCESVVFAT